MDNKSLYTGIGIAMALLAILMWALAAPHWVIATLAVWSALMGLTGAKSSRMAVTYAWLATVIMSLSVLTWWEF